MQPRKETLLFDAQVYRLGAIKKAVYKFAGQCFVEITTIADGQVCVTLEAKTGLDDLAQICGDFRNEVLDQDLREIIAEETAAIRSLLLAQAFSQTSLIDPTGETADYRADPLSIRPPDRLKKP